MKPKHHHKKPHGKHPDLGDKAEGRSAVGGSAPGGKVETEPTMDRQRSPMWLVILFGLMFYWAQLYLDQNAAGFDARVYEPFHSFAQLDAVQPKDPAALLAAKGKVAYEARCMACHQATGLGQAPLFPPLAGSEWVNTPGAARMVRIVSHGLTGPIKVNGQEFNNVMPPGLAEGLSDEDMAGLLTYVRTAWGNKGSAVQPALVKSVREKIASRGAQPWTAAELQGVPETE